MATPRKQPSCYPDEFGLLIRRAIGSCVKVEFPNPQRALAFRRQLYAFRQSLLDDPSYDVELTLLSRTATFSVDRNELHVSIPRMEALPDE